MSELTICTAKGHRRVDHIYIHKTEKLYEKLYSTQLPFAFCIFARSDQIEDAHDIIAI